jgi:prolyl 4-hydroxylase
MVFVPPIVLQDFNILRYNAGQHYNGHMDTFDPHTLAHNSPHFGQRMATFLMYLSDVEEGGETVFRFEGKYGESGIRFSTHAITNIPS